MKTAKMLIITLTFFSINLAIAQEFEDSKNVSLKQKREYVSKLSQQEKIDLMEKMKEDYVIRKLNIPSKNVDEFKLIYKNYREEQLHIKNRFKAKLNYNTLNDLEAEKELENSFKVGMELIENRRKYSDEFRKVIKPQQILDLFHTEGKFRAQTLSHSKKNKETIK